MDADTADSTVVTTVRLPTELRDALARIAAANKRSVSSEMVKRLADSVAVEDLGATAEELSKRVKQLRNELAHGRKGPAVQDGSGADYTGGRHTAHEALLLSLFEQMPPERQLALLTLLRGA